MVVMVVLTGLMVVLMAGRMLVVILLTSRMVADAKLVGAGGEFIDAGPFEGILGLEKAGIEVGGAAEVKAADVQHAVEGEGAVARAVDPGRRVHAVQARLEPVEVGGAREVGLVEENDVGEGDLLLRLPAVVEMLGDVPGVDDGDNAVEAIGVADFGVAEERLRHGAGVGQAGGLDEHAVEAVLALEEPAEDAEQVAAHGAAEAAVVHGEDLLVGLDDELVIDAHLAEFVLNDGDPAAVLFGENAVQQGGLAGAEEAGEHGDRNTLVGGHEEEKRESGKRLEERRNPERRE